MEPDELPTGWRAAQIGEICEHPQYGHTASAQHTPVGPKMLRITDIQDGRVDWPSVPYCRCDDVEKYRLKTGDILFARTGATTGKSFLVREVQDSVFASYLIRLRVRSGILPEFLFCYFQSSEYWAAVGGGIDDGNRPNMNGSKLAELVVPFPEKEAEQRRIVARVEELTNRLEQARQGRQAAITETQPMLNSLREDIYQKLLNDFPNKPLGKCGDVLGGGTPSKADEGYWNGNIPWVSAKEMWKFDVNDTSLKITERAVKETTVKLVPPGSVMFVVRGSILFKRVPVAVNRVQCTINQDMKAIVPIAELNGDFLAQMLWGANEDLKGMVDTAGNSAGKLPTERWETLPIPIPPPKEQKKVIARLDAMRGKLDELQRLQREVEAELASFTPALLAKAFRGEI